jgi:hypothetical protein
LTPTSKIFTMKKILFFLALLGSVQILLAQSFYPKLQVLNPKQQWQYDVATITEAQIFVRPKGIYMEYNIYMTYSAASTQLNKSYDTTEIVHYFNLPNNAIVTDSWLWVNDVIVKADLLDKWSATQIYESIVKRNQDPSILTKVGVNDYQFRIFPLPGGKTRKVKITVLVPIDFNSDRVRAEIPVNIFALSKVPLKKYTLAFAEVSGWQNPALNEKNNLIYKTETDATTGKYIFTEVPYNKELTSSISYNNPMTNGVYVAKYTSGKDNFYGLALQASKVYTTKAKSQKLTFAIAHDDTKTTTTWAKMLPILKHQMLKNLSATDSFNVVYTNFAATKYSKNWLSASAPNIDKVIDDLLSKINFEANLSSVLDEALTWNKEQKGDAIVLLTTSDAYGTIPKANAFIKAIEAKHTVLPTIHIIDYNDYNVSYFFNSGYYYWGNEYLYTYLTQKTGGNYAAWRVMNGAYSSFGTQKTFLETSASIMEGLAEKLKNVDVYTSLENGYCYSRYNFNNGSLFVANKAFVQTGKYDGNLPLNIQVAGEVGQQSFFKKITVAETEMVVIDSSLKQVWTGAYLAENEFKNATNNNTIKEILSISKKNRVLSQYTAFLALEPGMNQTVPCVKCNDETKITTVAINDEVTKDSVFIKTYPNPFREKVTLEITAKNLKENNAGIAIFDLTGKMLYEDQQVFDSEKAIFVWNEDAPKGMYIAQIKVGTKKYSVKLMKIE